MADVVHVLRLQGDAAAAFRVQETLVNAGLKCQWTLVSSRDEFLAALRGDVQLILADDSARGFTACQALRLAIEQRSEIPFICLAEELEEQDIVDRLKEGAYTTSGAGGGTKRALPGRVPPSQF